MITLGAADTDGTHDVHVGDEVIVQLPENPTTGHRWHLTLTSDGFTLAENTFHSEGTARPGSGGTREFRLRAEKPGTHQLGLLNKRSWENADAAATQLAFTVNVLP